VGWRGQLSQLSLCAACPAGTASIWCTRHTGHALIKLRLERMGHHSAMCWLSGLPILSKFRSSISGRLPVRILGCTIEGEPAISIIRAPPLLRISHGRWPHSQHMVTGIEALGETPGRGGFILLGKHKSELNVTAFPRKNGKNC
jgi:hypothetical protein